MSEEKLGATGNFTAKESAHAGSDATSPLQCGGITGSGCVSERCPLPPRFRDFPVLNPCVIVAGAQKAGTTALYHLLVQNPIFSRPTHKEPQFLSIEEPLDCKAVEWYRDVLQIHEGMALIDASTSYLWSPTATVRLPQFFVEPFIVVILRDPARRAFSSYLELYKRQTHLETRSFEEILVSLEGGNTGSLNEREMYALGDASGSGHVNRGYTRNGYHQRVLFAPSFRAEFDNPDWPFLYFSGSLYSLHVDRLEKAFPGRVKIIVFEDFVRRPDSIVADICEFMGLPCSTDLQVSKTPTYSTLIPRGRIGKRYHRHEVSNILAKFGKPGMWLANNLEGQLYIKRRIRKEEYERARQLLANEYAYWEAKLPIVKSLWTWNDS